MVGFYGMFKCHDCKSSIGLKELNDPTTSHGTCPVCGSSNWEIKDYDEMSSYEKIIINKL